MRVSMNGVNPLVSVSQDPTITRMEIQPQPAEQPVETNVAPAPAENQPANQAPLSVADQHQQAQENAEKMNELARIINQSLKFEVLDSNRIIVQIVDTKSGEVVRSIPPEELVKALKRMEDVMGFFVDKKV